MHFIAPPQSDCVEHEIAINYRFAFDHRPLILSLFLLSYFSLFLSLSLISFIFFSFSCSLRQIKFRLFSLISYWLQLTGFFRVLPTVQFRWIRVMGFEIVLFEWLAIFLSFSGKTFTSRLYFVHKSRFRSLFHPKQTSYLVKDIGSCFRPRISSVFTICLFFDRPL